jgi:long-chain fatty acid transport protein
VFNLFITTREINMKRTLLSFAVLGAVLATGTAQAGGWDRSGQDTSIILKEGSLLEVTSVSVKPKVTGTYNAAAAAGGSTAISNASPSYSFTTFGFRTEINEKMSLAIIQDSPFGAEVSWTGGAYNAIKAKVNSSATTLLMSYDLDNVTVYGGLKNQSFDASASLPILGYTITSTPDKSLGYVLGAAIEKPEIAMRVALTYHSAVEHDVAIVETSPYGVNVASILSAKTPSSFNLDFQTGIAANTLLFGTIRSVKWTETLLRPTERAKYTGSPSLKEFTQDTISYSLGLGRKFSDDWSGAVTYGTESAEGIAGGPLGPTDGYSKMGLGVTYTGEQATITLGMQKVNLGDISSEAGGGVYKAAMSDNTAIVTAVKVGYKF